MQLSPFPPPLQTHLLSTHTHTHSLLIQLDEERKKKSEEKDKIRKTMQGYVSHERERFERLAQQMKQKDKALAAKNKAIVVREKALAAQDQKLRQVKELIQNSPCSARTPLRESNVASGTPDPTRVS